MSRQARRTGRTWPIKLPAGWGPVKRSGALLDDLLVPALLLLLALLAVAMVLFAAGIVTGLIPYQ